MITHFDLHDEDGKYVGLCGYEFSTFYVQSEHRGMTTRRYETTAGEIDAFWYYEEMSMEEEMYYWQSKLDVKEATNVQ
jgi:hypothetical protein